jgi:hypothetical protein
MVWEKLPETLGDEWEEILKKEYNLGDYPLTTSSYVV